MAHNVNSGGKSLIQGGTTYLARAYRLKRPDGTFYRLTDHDKKLTIFEGFFDELAEPIANDFEYTPVDGFDSTASRQQSAMKASRMEFSGVFSSTLITNADLRAGLFNDAALDIGWFDWRYPWFGFVRHNKVRLTDFRYDGNRWTAQAINLFAELQRKTGRAYGRTCWHPFMSDGCGISKTPGTTTFSAQAITALVSAAEVRYDEGASSEIADTRPDDWFRAGHVKWLTGNNAGTLTPIKQSYKEVSGGGGANDARLLFMYPPRATVQVGDTFNLTAGCDKTLTACASTSLAGGTDNHLRFGGMPHMPGTSKVVQTGQLQV